ncbi:hypothetical protein AKJ37_01915 [candidate division MSBL1 archaeon SCGC-AAA259I09]|uniref:Water stress and hypersensitive response domain-containing protein n=1 Tax=candidate division MSBL1 archaeon SCGC-AAA259I09 TaxID=1698267 RepID=A0A133UUZ3_9EURY|nr:hypothetical protein AKJ37_01915 [candidate division MSBL1 archaeon SCGC-AAA259I09]
MEKKYIVAITIIGIIIVAGFGYEAYRYNQIREGINVDDVGVRNVSTEGPFGLPTEIELDLDVYVNNPTTYDLDIKRFSYHIKVEGRDFGRGSVRDVAIPAYSTTSVPVTVRIGAVDAIRTVWDYIREGDVEVRVYGVVDVPFKLFGVIEIFSISTTYDTRERPEYELTRPDENIVIETG